MYKKVDTEIKFVDREKEILKFWKENNIFLKSVKKNEGSKEFSFYDGPPTANGKPHIGHILTRVMKDIIPRYKTMKGFHVLRKAGWDTHGLPVELEVEKQLGIDGKNEIEKYGIEPFIQKCKESVWKYKSEWEVMSDRIGYWADMENPYITYDNNYIESVWWAISEMSKKGLLYKGYKIVPYCPRCGTALSSHEVAQGYKDVEDISIFVKFKVKNEDNTYFVAWTTTPWTLPSNVALCMNAKEKYSKIKVNNEFYIVAHELISNLFSEDEYELLDTKLGKEYEYTEYEPLFTYKHGAKEKGYYVTNAEYVSLTDGTGIVHIAPAFGEDDYQVGKKYGLPFVQLIDVEGKFIDVATDLVGKSAKSADEYIIKKLINENVILKTLKIKHSYPFCWRCETPLIYYARSSWFIAMSKLKKELLKSNDSVNWMPANIKQGRMGNFLENVIDWGISRERYWGTPLPIWVCKKCGKIKVVGSKKELLELSGRKKDIELHRPYIDKLTFTCECGSKMHRTLEVLDCWFDSGSMPFAQWHYPFENKEIFEKVFPANFISEAVDQTRGWFYTLLAVSTVLFKRSPFKNCIVLGHVNDKNGIKMSKHKGNVVDPWTVLDKQGADATRWSFYTDSMPWLPSRFSPENVSESQRKFLGTLWNTYAFYVLYADIDKFDPSKYKFNYSKISLLDKWIISELNTLIKFVDEGLNNYMITETARKIEEFVDKLSNWYVRRSRDRFWGSTMDADKVAAYTTMYEVLSKLTKVIAPYVPFMAEMIYQNIEKPFFDSSEESVHLCEFPKFNKKYINEDIEKNMSLVLDIVVLARAARNKVNIKNRQPIASLYYTTQKELSDDFLYLVKDEINVKEVKINEKTSEYVEFELKPQLKTLGPKYGKLLGDIRNEFSSNASKIMNSINTNGNYSFKVNETKIELNKEDLLIQMRNKEGFASESSSEMTVVLDVHLTDELIEEGIERELVSKIQSMRKEAGFEVTDHIYLSYTAVGTTLEILKKQKFMKDILCDEIISNISGFTKELDVYDDKVTVTIARV